MFAKVSIDGIERPEKYCAIDGCIFPELFANYVCDIPLSFIALFNRSRI